MKWRLPEPISQSALTDQAQEWNVSSILARVMLTRKVPVSNFTHALWHAPELLPGITDAADLITSAIASDQLIAIYGDYDVDGVTATAILTRTLRRLRARVIPYVPHRHYDGYGPQSRVLRRFAHLGVKLLITADCGITAAIPLSLARSFGMQVIITDHHEPRNILPDVEAMVHPRLRQGNYPWGGLCGAGVALKLALHLHVRHQLDPQPDDLVLASFGTIADVVPLLDENRTIVQRALRSAPFCQSPGILSILSVAGIDPRRLSAQQVAFQVAPRLNAAGRLSCAFAALELFTTADPARAMYLANHCSRLNEVRKSLERKIFAEAVQQCDETSAMQIVVGDRNEWHPGVVGIVASRLTEHTGRPVLIGTSSDQSVSGSGRSVPGISLHEVIDKVRPLLSSGGGHAQAVGWSVSRDNFSDFTRLVQKATPTSVAPEIHVDACISLSDLNLDLLTHLSFLAPFGAGNPEPVLCCQAVGIDRVRAIGKDKSHVALEIVDNDTVRRGVLFGGAHRLAELQVHMNSGELVDIIFRPSINEWQGQKNAELHLLDFRPA